jgi:thiamine biosynthesis protein ThiI
MSEFQRIVLVHYHELGLKGHNRPVFERRLVFNLRSMLDGEPIEVITRISGRVLVVMDEDASLEDSERVTERIVGVPGVARVSCGFRVPRDIDAIDRAAADALGEAGPFDTWRVTARRNHTDFPLDTMEIQAEVGEYLCGLYPDKKVQMKGADADVHVEVVQGKAYVYALTVPGVGGLPVGTSGKVVCLLSSGIDSPVATWRMARRGATCVAVHFSGRPQTQSTSEYLVDDIAHVLEKTGCIARVYTVPFGDYQRAIAGMVPPNLRIIMYRRMMMRVAERIAKKEGAKALVTGESLAQVASQTLDNLICTNAAADMMILRPLIGMDKQEIIADAKQLGTYEISSSPAPDCCTLFMPRSPETHAKLRDVLAAEKDLPIDAWLDEIMTQKLEVRQYKQPMPVHHDDPGKDGDGAADGRRHEKHDEVARGKHDGAAGGKRHGNVDDARSNSSQDVIVLGGDA